MDLQTMTDSELETRLAALTDDEAQNLSIELARYAASKKGQIGPDESRRINRCHSERAHRIRRGTLHSRDHILSVAQTIPATQGEPKVSNQTKPEPDPTVIAEKAREYQAQQHAKGNKFFSITQAVAHVRKEMGLSNDHISGDAALSARSIAQPD